MRDHENAQKKYEEIRAKQMSAKISENLEQENKAERFTLLEPPLMPDKPTKPNRIKILLMGSFLALAGSGGLVMLLETLNQRMRGQEALAVAIRQRALLVAFPTSPSRTSSQSPASVVPSACSSRWPGCIVLSLILLHLPTCRWICW